MSEVATPTRHAALAARVSEHAGAQGWSAPLSWGTSRALATPSALPHYATRTVALHPRDHGSRSMSDPTAAAPHTAPSCRRQRFARPSVHLRMPANSWVETPLMKAANGCFVGPVSVALARYPERVGGLGVTRTLPPKSGLPPCKPLLLKMACAFLVPAGPPNWSALSWPTTTCQTGVHVAQPRHLIHIARQRLCRGRSVVRPPQRSPKA